MARQSSVESAGDSRGLSSRGKPRGYSALQKGGDPAAGSPTATLLRLRPSHRLDLRRLPPCGWPTGFGSIRLNAGSPPRGPGRTAGNWERELRSLRDLTQHLTTRADDSHAAPVLALRRGADVSTGLHQHVKPR